MSEQVALINDVTISADKDADDLYYDLGFIEDLENYSSKANHYSLSPNSNKLNQSVNGCSSNFKKDSNWCLNKTITNGSKGVSILTTHQRTIYTAGRPPWYNAQGQAFEPFVIGICGGSASGKTTVATKIIEALDVPWVTLLSLDSFYKVLNQEESKLASANEYNFDHPDAFDFKLMIETLQKLKEGKRVDVPIYNFVTHSREKRRRIMYGANVIILEGILIFYSKQLLDMIDMKVFIDTDPDIRLARRLKRDICERGRELEGVIKQYNQFVKPSFDYYIAPSVRHADLIVPRGGQNQVAINLIVQHVHKQLQLRGIQLRSKLLKSHMGQPLPETLKILPTSQQIEGIQIYIRNGDVCKKEVIPSPSITLMRLLIEFALSLSPFKNNQAGSVYVHNERDNKLKVCGVSIMRSAETMEQALCDVLEDVKLGKILIKTNQITEEPELYYLRLPKDIEEYRIIVMDSTVTSGSAAMMAIRILLDHDVLEENIVFCSLLMAASGIRSIAYAFPKVKIFTTAVEFEEDEKKSAQIKPDF